MNYGKTYNKQSPVLISDKSIFCEKGGRLLSDIIYPVGSIYISVNSTNPSVYFGGSWEQIKDRFLLACGTTYSNGTTGGEAEHQLTVNEMPSHSHNVVYSNNGKYIQLGTGGNQYSISWGANGFNGGAEMIAANTGGNQTHNNMPPYLAVYVWKRIE